LFDYMDIVFLRHVGWVGGSQIDAIEESDLFWSSRTVSADRIF